MKYNNLYEINIKDGITRGSEEEIFIKNKRKPFPPVGTPMDKQHRTRSYSCASPDLMERTNKCQTEYMERLKAAERDSKRAIPTNTLKKKGRGRCLSLGLDDPKQQILKQVRKNMMIKMSSHGRKDSEPE